MKNLPTDRKTNRYDDATTKEEAREEVKVEQRATHSIRTSAILASSSPTLPFNSSAAAVEVEVETAKLHNFSSTDQHKLLKRFLLTSSPTEQASSTDDKSPTNFLVIKGVLGHRLTIPCSNLSLNEIASFANAGGKVITHQAAAAQQTSSSSSSSSTTTRRQNQRLRGQSSFSGGVKDSTAVRTTVANGQGISLIVWHKDDKLNSPVFTADARGASSLREAKQQTSYESLRGRARLEESTRLDSRGLGSTPALVIEEAAPEDSGTYTCTIEFYKAPTQTHQAHVELISK